MDEGVLLVVFEVNVDVMFYIKLSNKKGVLIVNLNCLIIICFMVVMFLYWYVKVKRMVVSIYQVVSGVGVVVMVELEFQIKEVFEGKEFICNIFNRQYVFNLFFYNLFVIGNGYNEEEMKFVKEICKIWSDNDVKVIVMCIRVFVMRVYVESINFQFEIFLDEEKVCEIFFQVEGLIVIDDCVGNNFFMFFEVFKKDVVVVGCIR